MPQDDQNQEVAPVETGFAALSQATPEPTPAQVQADHDILVAQIEAERASIKAAAQAEERRQVQILEQAEEPKDTRSDARKFNDQLHQRILDARQSAKEAEAPKPPQPASQHIMDQTKREMAEGARQSKWHADQRAAALGGKPPPEPRRGLSPRPTPGGSVEVFRPDDYIPDPVKNAGHVRVTS